MGSNSLASALVEVDSGKCGGGVVKVKGDSRETRWLILPVKVQSSLA